MTRDNDPLYWADEMSRSLADVYRGGLDGRTERYRDMLEARLYAARQRYEWARGRKDFPPPSAKDKR